MHVYRFIVYFSEGLLLELDPGVCYGYLGYMITGDPHWFQRVASKTERTGYSGVYHGIAMKG